MKKKILFCAALAVCLGAGAFTAHAWSKTDRQDSDLVSANIEALADGESDRGFQFVSKNYTELEDGSVRVICTCGGDGSLPCC